MLARLAASNSGAQALREAASKQARSFVHSGFKFIETVARGIRLGKQDTRTGYRRHRDPSPRAPSLQKTGGPSFPVGASGESILRR